MTEEVIDFFVESLEDWRGKHYDTEKIILVGHSLGGYLASWYALKYPERIEKLILVSPVGLPENEAPTDEDGDRQDAFKTQSGRTVPHTALTRFVSSLWDRHYTPQWLIRTAGPFGPKLVRSYTMRRFHYLTSEESLHLRDYLYHISAFEKGSAEFAAMGTILAPFAYARKPLLPYLSGLKVPTDFMYGDDDWMDHRHAVKAQECMYSAGNKETKVHVVSGAGHHLYLDNPTEFNKLLIESINNK